MADFLFLECNLKIAKPNRDGLAPRLALASRFLKGFHSDIRLFRQYTAKRMNGEATQALKNATRNLTTATVILDSIKINARGTDKTAQDESPGAVLKSLHQSQSPQQKPAMGEIGFLETHYFCDDGE